MPVSRETRSWTQQEPHGLLLDASAKINVTLNPETAKRLISFLQEISAWNRRINLIGPGDLSRNIVLHLVDSLTPLPFLPQEKIKHLDIGSGAGLPGLVLKFLRPQWESFLLESKEKKTAFIKHAIRKFALPNTTALKTRIGEKHQEEPIYDLVSFRALGSLDLVLPWASSCCRPGGTVLAYKGPSAHEELLKVKPNLPQLSLSAPRQENLVLPYLDQKRVLLFFQKKELDLA